MTPEDTDARAERLLQVGLDVAVRIRDEDPDDVAGTLTPLDPVELRDLAVLLAACVDISKPLSALTSWLGEAPQLSLVPAEIALCPRCATRSTLPPPRSARGDVDQVRVDEAVVGRVPASDLNTAERKAAVRALVARGLSDDDIAERLRWRPSTARSAARELVLRFRGYHGIPPGIPRPGWTPRHAHDMAKAS